MNKLLHFIRYTLGPSVTPLAYLFAGKSAVLGFYYAFLQSEGVRNSILFKQDAGIGIEYYGILLFLASVVLLLAMFWKNEILVRSSSFALLLIAVWSMTVYGFSGYFELAVLSFIDMLCWGYYYLASYVGTLWDYKPDLDTHRPFR